MNTQFLEKDQLAEIARELTNSNGERRQIIENFQSVYQCSTQQIYKWARQGGWSSERKKRSDTGARRRAVSDEAIERAVLVKHLSTNGRYVSPMSAHVALDVAGVEDSGVKPHHVTKKMREMQINKKAATVPTPHITRRTSRPNEEHQFDTSNCVVWYLDKKNRIRVNPQARKDKNKAPRNNPVIRYVVVDHFTHMMFFQYQREFESFVSSARFLHKAWTPKPDPEKLPFCGVPKTLYIDNGPTCRSAHFQQLCEHLGVEIIDKQPTGTRSKSGKLGHPRALGSVETANWIIEREFETRLGFRICHAIDELNDWAYKWCIWWNGVRKHSRYGLTRSALWSQIRNDELRIPPEDLDTFMALAARRAVCHIYPDLTLRFKGERYLLESIPVDLRCTKAEVMHSPFASPEIRVKAVDGNWYSARPLKKLPASEGGYYENAVPSGTFKSHKDTTAEKSQKQLESRKNIVGVNPFPKFDERLQNIRFLQKAGRKVELPPSPFAIPRSEAMERIKQRLGRWVRMSEWDRMKAEYGDWMTSEEIEHEIQELLKSPALEPDQTACENRFYGANPTRGI